MALRRPGDRAVLLLARLLQVVDVQIRNPMLRGMLNHSDDAKAFIAEARQIVADARMTVPDGAADLARGIDGTVGTGGA